MKKVISLVLVCIIAFSSLCIAAYAEDTNQQYAKSYMISVDPDQVKMIEIIGTDGKNYVKEGEDFTFTLNTLGRYTFDQSTVIKAWPVTHYADVVEGSEHEKYGQIIYPDSNGVYTVEGVDVDLYIKVYNLSETSLASVKDMLMNMLNFFINWIKWFFGV